MSAPNAGRQSPDPETQSGRQGESAPADGQIDAAPEGTKDAKSASDDAKSNTLESNPEHPLNKHAEAKASKEGRGDGV